MILDEYGNRTIVHVYLFKRFSVICFYSKIFVDELSEAFLAWKAKRTANKSVIYPRQVSSYPPLNLSVQNIVRAALREPCGDLSGKENA